MAEREEVPDRDRPLSEGFSEYPLAVREAIDQLKSNYDLEDGDIETVVNSLWSEDSGYYEVKQYC